MGAIWVKPIKILQNEDVTRVYGFASLPPAGTSIQSSTALVLTGMTAKMQVRMNQLTTSTLLLSLATGGLGLALGSGVTSQGIPVGTITITVPYTTTASLPPGEWFYDLALYSPQQKYYMQGPFAVAATGTR